ncbi:MAG: class II fructose-bisphosphate aldolase [Lachnospiraceae bacterium]
MIVNLNDVLMKAKREKYAIGLFNAVSLEMARAIIEAAEEKKSPVIIGTAEILLPYASMEEVFCILSEMGRRANIPVVIHYDHGLTFDMCIKALQLGCTSIMYDCSLDNYDENIRKVSEMVKIAHAMGATVEGELGHVGSVEGGSIEGGDSSKNLFQYYTDVNQAYDYVKKTGVDALAVAVGNAHGAYKFQPKLDYERINAIKEKIDIPLVLHGGSGLSDQAFKTAIQEGITKVNIFTDLNIAGMEGIKKAIKDGKDCITDIIPYEIEAMKNTVKNKIELFGSTNKA